MSYKDLKNNFLEEVAKIDVGKLSLGGFGNTYRDYAELLKAISELPEEGKTMDFLGMGFGVKNEAPKKGDL